MRKRSTFSLFLLSMLFLASCQEEQKEADEGLQEGRLHLSASKPQPGQELRLVYEKTADASEMPEATVDYIVNKSSYPEDIQLKDTASYWVGRISIPDSATAMAFNFVNDFKYENNDKKGYVIPLYSEEGEKLAGSGAAIGTYYLRSGMRYDLNVEKDSALAMIGRDLEAHPEINNEYDDFYSSMLMRSDESAAKTYIDQRLAYYKGKDAPSDEDLMKLYMLYGLKKEKNKADSIEAVGSEKFPKGELAERSFYFKFREASSEEKLEVFNEYRERFGTEGRFYNSLATSVARDYAAKGDFEKALELSATLDKSEAARYLNSVAWDLAEKGKNLEQAEKLSARSLELQKQALKSEEKPDYLSKKQFENSLSSGLASFYDTYGLINYKLGNLDEAVEAQEKAITDYSSAEVNTRYVQFLNESGQYEKARETATDFIENNRGSDEMKTYLEKAYSESKEDAQDFNEYLASLEAVADKNLKQDLQEEMITETAPAFTMKDLEGSEVALASQKGKIVILDFWATWCGPCKSSFPGMKDAVEKYSSNPNVEFFFVDTFENGPTRNNDVAGFIKENDYPFHVLIDEAKEANGYKTADAYGIQGIPTKVIIGPEGNIRFKMVGYDGNNAKMVKELGMIIDMLAEENTAVAAAE